MALRAHVNYYSRDRETWSWERKTQLMLQGAGIKTPTWGLDSGFRDFKTVDSLVIDACNTKTTHTNPADF